MEHVSIRRIVGELQVYPQNPVVLVFIAGLNIEWHAGELGLIFSQYLYKD